MPPFYYDLLPTLYLTVPVGTMLFRASVVVMQAVFTADAVALTGSHFDGHFQVDIFLLISLNIVSAIAGTVNAINAAIAIKIIIPFFIHTSLLFIIFCLK